MLKEFELPLFEAPPRPTDFASELRGFEGFGSKTLVTETVSSDGRLLVPTFSFTALLRTGDDL